jgi:hypothetical protein
MGVQSGTVPDLQIPVSLLVFPKTISKFHRS